MHFSFCLLQFIRRSFSAKALFTSSFAGKHFSTLETTLLLKIYPPAWSQTTLGTHILSDFTSSIFTTFFSIHPFPLTTHDSNHSSIQKLHTATSLKASSSTNQQKTYIWALKDPAFIQGSSITLPQALMHRLAPTRNLNLATTTTMQQPRPLPLNQAVLVASLQQTPSTDGTATKRQTTDLPIPHPTTS